MKHTPIALAVRLVCIVCLGLALLTAGAGCSHKKKGAAVVPADSKSLPPPAKTLARPTPAPPCPPTPQSERSVAVRAQREADLRNQFRLASLTLGAPIYIRIFKESKELEVWVQRNERFKLFKKYPIARFSGGLGPKMREGDLQAPEGFYAVTAERMNPWSNFHLAFNVGYPNEYDLLRGATGGAIMVHGKKDSVGCFAMTDPAIEEIYTIADYALNSGQLSFPVHIFPFRMTVANLMRHTRSPHLPFWRNLLRGYTLFELTRLPPTVSLNNQAYAFTTGKPVRPTTLVAQVQPPARTTQPVATARTLPQNPRPAQQAALQETRPAAAPAPARPARLTTTQATRMAPPATPVRRSGQAIP